MTSAFDGLNNPDQLPEILPIFPLSGALLLPGGQLPLNIFEPRYLTMIEDALGNGRLIGMVQPSSGTKDHPVPNTERTFDVGCVGRIVEFHEMDDGRFLVNLFGVSRFKVLEELDIERGYRRIKADYSPYASDQQEPEDSINRDLVLQSVRTYLDTTPSETGEAIEVNWKALEQAGDNDLVNALAMMGPFEPREKQALLEATSLTQRAELLVTMMSMVTADDGQGGGNIN